MIQLLEYKESPIQFEVIEGQVMANATLMCKAFGKRFNDWMELKSTKEYIEALKRNLTTGKNGSSEIQLVTTRNYSPNKGGGSWIDQHLIISLTRWLDVPFSIWCDIKVAELLRTGVTSIDGNLSKVIDALTGLVGAVTTLRSEVDDLKNANKITQKAASVEKQTVGVIDARHRTYQVVERNGIQMRCIKLEDKEWFAMIDLLLGIKCNTSPWQYAKALNRNGKANAAKIWLFGQSREQWFVNEDGLKLLMSKQ